MSFSSSLYLTEDKVVKYEKDPVEKHPVLKALNDPDVMILPGRGVHGLASSTFTKGLLAYDDYQYIVIGGVSNMYRYTGVLTSSYM